ncbi:tetratricopeptide repeat protein [Patiriisocius hiemis]|uniref:Tetratricopeptide repeat protein n=1 Tax=Patiriisocius hiemis TaxID=3075604 RepID=A0ABU2Y985_9FLAO|nr:tetratricopeptide repeat protein [Constantimarinum sp. W242]MDT0554738.1 tetratricopeptide repeat protein [Constantimarinum sp. W242]
MATYKKRGGKPRTKAEKQVELEDDSATAEVFNTLDSGASKTEAWIEKNQKAILGVIGTIAVCVLGYLLYQQFVQEPKETEAMNEMFQAQKYYNLALNAPQAKDSLYNLSLNGGEGKYGFIDIVDEYSGTDAANMANYYAGMAFLQTGKYQDAISHLQDFSSDDAMLGPLAKGAIGDAFVQVNQEADALKYYEDAAKMQENEVTTPRFLLKAGITAMNLGETSKALEHFSAIFENYPNSTEATKAEAYKGMTEAKQ